MKMVLVNWEDSNIMHGWRVPEETTEDRVADCQTIGFVIADDEDKVILAMGKSNLGAVMECITIPRSCIQSIRELRLK